MTGTRTSYLGKRTSRIDGHAKVSGAAKYAAEHKVAGLAYGFVVTAAIAKGRIRRIHTADALAVTGVLDVFTHENRPKLAVSAALRRSSPIQWPARGAGRGGGARDCPICRVAYSHRI